MMPAGEPAVRTADCDLKESCCLVSMPVGGRIALHRIRADGTQSQPVIVAHGTISNAATVRPLATFLARHGFDCWMLEWGGHGDSRHVSSRQNSEFPAFHDLPAAVDEVLTRTGSDQLFWVSHSGGGHLPLMYLGRHPEHQDQFAGLITLGTQSTHMARGLRNRLGLCALVGITTVLGRTPRAILPLGNEPEPTRLLAQWARWNLKRKWYGTDGLDYLAALEQVSIPVKIVAGARDQVAPADGCRAIFDALGGRDKTWVLCGTEAGFSRDFGHGELIRGQAAREELFPRMVRWLQERDKTRTPPTADRS